MAIEVYISSRKNGESGLKKSGDVLRARLPSSTAWGSEERGVVVMWTDVSLEGRLQALKDAGDPDPFIDNPYAEYEVVGTGDTRQRVMVNRSRIYVDFTDMDPRDKIRLESRISTSRPLLEHKLTTKVRNKETQRGTPTVRNPIPPTKKRT